VPTEKDNIARVNLLLIVWVLSKQESQNNKIHNIDVQVKDSQEIVDKYLEVSTIEGIISL
jgi:hypothetical protein